jgi:hypothetical protein
MPVLLLSASSVPERFERADAQAKQGIAAAHNVVWDQITGDQFAERHARVEEAGEDGGHESLGNILVADSQSNESVAQIRPDASEDGAVVGIRGE